MIYDIQKAMIWKRISAFLFDMIILSIVATGIAYIVVSLLHYDRYAEIMNETNAKYEQQYQIDFQISEEEFNKLTPEQKQVYDDAVRALTQDETATGALVKINNIILTAITASVLLGYMVTEFAIPLFLKNGQSLGKKIFGIGVMKSSGVKINTPTLLIRTLLGKGVIETMIPVYMAVLIVLGYLGIYGTFLIFGLLAAQVILLAVTKNHTLIHDLMAKTVVIDMSSQMIFDSEDAMIAYKKKLHAQKAADAGR